MSKRANLGRSIESHTKKMKKLHIEMDMIHQQGQSNAFLNWRQLIDQGNSKDEHQLQNACIAAREAGELLQKFATLLESRRKVIMAQNEVSAFIRRCIDWLKLQFSNLYTYMFNCRSIFSSYSLANLTIHK